MLSHLLSPHSLLFLSSTDFRSANGIYAKSSVARAALNIPALPARWKPWHLFERKRFRQQPAPLLALVRTLQEADLEPQPAHRLVAKLGRSGRLLRCFTQNIDGLEQAAGASSDRIVYVHGRLPPHNAEINTVSLSPVSATAAIERHIAFIGDDVALPGLEQDLAAASVLLVMGTSFTAATAADIAADCPAARVLVTLPGSGGVLPPRRRWAVDRGGAKELPGCGGETDSCGDDFVVEEDAQTFAQAALECLGQVGHVMEGEAGSRHG
jgi:NAD-dependent SIR2 family protein deacetylase